MRGTQRLLNLTNHPSHTLLDLCVGDLEQKWARSVVVIAVVVVVVAVWVVVVVVGGGADAILDERVYPCPPVDALPH